MVPWLAVVTLSYWATGPWILQQLWNPYLPFPFFTLLLLQAWLVGSGQARRLAGMAFVGSFLVQTHVSYAIPVLGVGGWALARLVVAEHRAGRSLRRWSLWRAPAIVLAVVWFVPLVVDTAAALPGQTFRLVKFYAGLDPGRHCSCSGSTGRSAIMATEFRWRPPWLGGADPLNRFTAADLTVVGGMDGRPGGPHRWLVVDGPLAATGRSPRSWPSSGRCRWSPVRWPWPCSPVRAYPYLFFWRITIGAYVVVMGLVVVAETVPDRRARGRPWPCERALVVVTAVASVSLTRAVTAADGPVTPAEPVAASILGAAAPRWSAAGEGPAAHLRGGRRGSPCRRPRPAGPGGGAGLRRRRARVPVRRTTARPPRPRWARCGTSSRRASCTAWSRGSPACVVLAVSHPLPRAEQAELVALQRRMADELTGRGPVGRGR